MAIAAMMIHKMCEHNSVVRLCANVSNFKCLALKKCFIACRLQSDC